MWSRRDKKIDLNCDVLEPNQANLIDTVTWILSDGSSGLVVMGGDS